MYGAGHTGFLHAADFHVKTNSAETATEGEVMGKLYIFFCFESFSDTAP